jgi:type I restriction enzyme, S subunit
MEKVLLRNIIEISKGKQHTSVFSSNGSGKKRYIQIDDLRNDSNLKYTDQTGVEVNTSDLIIAWDGANAGTIGFNLLGYIGSTLARLRLKNKDFDSKFLGCYLRSKSKELRENCTGATIPHISRAYLESIEIPKLDLGTQKEIAQILEEAELARQKRKAANTLTDQFLQSTFLSMFGDPIINRNGWQNKTLSEVIDSIDSGWSPVCDDDNRTNEAEWAVLKLSAVTYGKFVPDKNKKLPNQLVSKRLESIEVKKGDLLFTRKNTKELIAATAFVFDCPKRLLMSDTIFRINYRLENISGIYLWYLFSEKNFRLQLQSLASGSSGSMPNISKEKLMRVELPVPPLFIQQRFASIVADAEQLRQKQKQNEIELENLFQSLLQKYFG